VTDLRFGHEVATGGSAAPVRDPLAPSWHRAAANRDVSQFTLSASSHWNGEHVWAWKPVRSRHMDHLADGRVVSLEPVPEPGQELPRPIGGELTMHGRTGEQLEQHPRSVPLQQPAGAP
jgi:hypothetical protein